MMAQVTTDIPNSNAYYLAMISLYFADCLTR